MVENITLGDSIEAFFEDQLERLSPNTQRAYKRGLNAFLESLLQIEVKSSTKVSEISTIWFNNFITSIKELSPSTQHVFLQATITWSKFISERYSIDFVLNTTKLFRKLPKIRKSTKKKSSDFHAISKIVSYVMNLSEKTYDSNKENLRALRDKALILLLADTGVDLATITNARKNDLDWDNKQLLVNTKNGSDSISITPRVIDALENYLDERKAVDDVNTRSANLLPLFSRHDKGAGQKTLKITEATVRNIVKQRSQEALGKRKKLEITPVSFRHYFINTLSQSFSSFHPKIAGKCRIYFDTGLYDDAIFNAMKIVEDEVRQKSSLPNTAYGVSLITDAMNPKMPILVFSSVPAEQESAYYLFRGALGSFKNPLSHRFLETKDPVKTFEILSLASLLMRMLDEVKKA